MINKKERTPARKKLASDTAETREVFKRSASKTLKEELVPDDFLLTTAEVCAVMQWHPRTLRRKEIGGLIKPKRHLRHKRYSNRDVQRLIQEEL